MLRVKLTKKQAAELNRMKYWHVDHVIEHRAQYAKNAMIDHIWDGIYNTAGFKALPKAARDWLDGYLDCAFGGISCNGHIWTNELRREYRIDGEWQANEPSGGEWAKVEMLRDVWIETGVVYTYYGAIA